MAKLKLESFKQSLKNDIVIVFNHHKVETPYTMQELYSAFRIICTNRAYDDNHPTFSTGLQSRLLPFDGRDYCFLYVNGANDTHIKSLLESIQKELNQ